MSACFTIMVSKGECNSLAIGDIYRKRDHLRYQQEFNY